MNADSHEQVAHHRILELVNGGAHAELQLLKKERKAERHLADALDMLNSDKARLRKIQQRIERSREAVATAEARLRAVQASRAEGPGKAPD